MGSIVSKAEEQEDESDTEKVGMKGKHRKG